MPSRTQLARSASFEASAEPSSAARSAPRDSESQADAAAARPEALPEPAPPESAAPTQRPAESDAELVEMREIARAERLLSDDPERALALTRSLQAGYPTGYFHEERAYLEVMALRELGRTREMREKAAVFLRAYPAGLYSSRVRKAVTAGGN